MKNSINYSKWIFTLLSIFSILGVTLGNATSLFGSSLSLAESFILALLGVMLGALAFDNWTNSEHIKDSLKEIKFQNINLFKSLNDINVFQVIEGDKNIAEQVNRDVKKAKKHIRATSFGTKEPKTIKGNYYGLIAKQIKDEPLLKYSTAYSILRSKEDRKQAFSILDENELNRLSHYKFNNDQVYLNVLIFDDEVAYIGFPNDSKDTHMQTVLRVENKSDDGSEFIKNLVSWYKDYVIKKDKDETRNLFNTSNYE